MASTVILSNYEGVYEVANEAETVTVELSFWAALIRSRNGRLTIRSNGYYPITVTCKSGETLNGETSIKITQGSGEAITIYPTDTSGEMIIA